MDSLFICPLATFHHLSNLEEEKGSKHLFDNKMKVNLVDLTNCKLDNTVSIILAKIVTKSQSCCLVLMVLPSIISDKLCLICIKT